MVTIQILLAVYNGEHYLPELLDSIIKQDYSDFTVLVQDDGSTDGTAGIISEICRRDARFSMGRQCGQHLGAKGNFFSLLSQSDADYTALCDQDDVWMPNRLSCCIEKMHRGEKQFGKDVPLLVHSDSILIDSSGKEICSSFFERQHWDKNAVSLQKLLVQNNATGCTMLLNRHLAELCSNIKNDNGIFMHDWWIALAAASFGHVVIEEKPLVKYRQHDTNVQGASKKGMLKRCMDALKNSGDARERIKVTYRQAKHFYDVYGDKLPDEAKKLLTDYISTENMNKLKRIITVRRMGCVMQNSVMRAGQIIFG